MRVYRISKCNFISDPSGTGAALYGGRWNSRGTYMVYTAATPSLALLESVVHISSIKATGYCMICLEIPDNSIATITINNLPQNWFVYPPPDALQSIGDNFIQQNEYLALKLPSVIMPEESNYLLNPKHQLFNQIKTLYIRTIPIDERLVRNSG